MKLLKLILISSVATIAMAQETNSTSVKVENNNSAIKKEAIGYMKMLGKELQTNLKAKMKEDKTGVEAAKFCIEKAGKIAKSVNEKLPKYAKVRRTALKIRNPKNSPDELDTKVLNEYQKTMDDKKFNPKDIKIVSDGNITRVYKPLVVAKACLKCHGENITPEIKSVISKKYPDDKAIGFKEGDLRGAIVVEFNK